MSWFQEYIVSNIWIFILIIWVGVYCYNYGYKAGAQHVLDIWKMQIRGDNEHE